jgi:hypothetical protein
MQEKEENTTTDYTNSTVGKANGAFSLGAMRVIRGEFDCARNAICDRIDQESIPAEAFP